MLRVFVAALVLFGNLFTSHAVQFPRLLPTKHSRSKPYTYIGQVLFSSGKGDYLGSGSVVGASGVLTAGHNVYDASNGWSTDMEFNRGEYGSAILNTAKPTQMYLLSGYQQSVKTNGADDVISFAFDGAGLKFGSPLVDGTFLGVNASSFFISPSWAQIGVGYAAEGRHDGNYPFISAARGFLRTRGGFFEARNIYFEGGMSGGPVLVPVKAGVYQVAGLIVSSSSGPVYGGIRVMDASLASLVKTYLRDPATTP